MRIKITIPIHFTCLQMLILYKIALICAFEVTAASSFAKSLDAEEYSKTANDPIYLTQADKPVYKGGRYIERAWNEYNSGNYDRALTLFKEASRYPRMANNAKLGLALTYQKLGNDNLATLQYEELVETRYELETTLPNLLDLLIKDNNLDKAQYYIDNYGNTGKYKDIVSRNKLSLDFSNAKNSNNPKAISNFVTENNQQLQTCYMPYGFLELSILSKNLGDIKQSKYIMNQLLMACPNEWELREIIYNRLIEVSENDEILEQVEIEISRTNLPSDYSQKLRAARFMIIKDKISEDPDSEESRKLREEIMAEYPNDPSLLLELAWWNYNQGNYDEAYSLFKELQKVDSSNSDYNLGLGYTLLKLDRIDEAIDIIKLGEIQEEDLQELKFAAYIRKAEISYQNENYQDAQSHLKMILTVRPNKYNAKELLGWSYFNQGEYAQAQIVFLELYDEKQDHKMAEAILLTHEKLQDKKSAYQFSQELSNTDDEQTRNVIGDYYYRNDMYISAAQVYSNSEKPYFNLDKPIIGLQPFYRFKSGTSGLSEINEVAIPLEFSYPFERGSNISFSFVTHWLDAGNASSNAQVGTFTPGQPRERELIESMWLFTPEIRYTKEGVINLNIGIGLTPLSGTVYPLPTFFIEAKQTNWRFNVHQNSVRQSILSYVGLNDPFSNKEWGRVLRTGTEGQITFNATESYWISLLGGYDYFWGENVEGNNAFLGTLATGKSFSLDNFNVSAGVFVAVQHFENNVNFFTFGNAGYFSPEFFIMTGPTFHIETKSFDTYWIEADIGGGYLYFKEGEGTFFPLNGTGGKLRGDTESKFGINASLELQKLMTKNLSMGLLGDVNNSADFTEVVAGLSLYYSFGARNIVVPDKRKKSWFYNY